LGGQKKCWSFDNAEMQKGRKQHRDALPENYRGAWVLIPDCYIYRNGFVERSKAK
jgi:DNA-binding ferritin-like protein (Dps family)